MNSTLLATVATLLTLIAFPAMLLAQSNDGLQLGQESEQEESQDPETLNLGPATATEQLPAKPPPNSAATAGTASGSVRNDRDLVRTTYGAWEVACAKSGSPCVMAQIGNDEAGTPMLEMVLRKLPEPQSVQGVPVVAVTDIITPLGVVLTPGIIMKIDSGEEQRAPYQICTEQGCLVREPLAEEAIARFKKGRTSKLTIVAAQQGSIEVDLSLSGFTKAFEALK